MIPREIQVCLESSVIPQLALGDQQSDKKRYNIITHGCICDLQTHTHTHTHTHRHTHTHTQTHTHKIWLKVYKTFFS